MAETRSRSPLARFRPRPETLRWGGLVVAAELLALLVYVLWGDSYPLTIRGLGVWLYPFVWIDVSLWAVVRTRPGPASARSRRLAGLLAVGYFGVLAYAGGLVAHGHGAAGLAVVWTTIPPGWGPAITYAGEGLKLVVVPYRVVGYVALAYLVYATVLDATRSAVTGLFGVLSCVSCSWPVLASLATGLVGSGSALASVVYSGSYALSTVVFVATVGLLYWRPFGDGA